MFCSVLTLYLLFDITGATICRKADYLPFQLCPTSVEPKMYLYFIYDFLLCQELQQSLMIGVIEGGDVLEERLRSARETAKRPVAGFLLDAFQGNTMTKETKLELLSSVTAELPEDKPRSELNGIFI